MRFLSNSGLVKFVSNFGEVHEWSKWKWSLWKVYEWSKWQWGLWMIWVMTICPVWMTCEECDWFVRFKLLWVNDLSWLKRNICVIVNDYEVMCSWTIGKESENIKRGSMNMSVCIYIMSIIVYVVNLSIYIVSMSVYGVNVSEHEWFWLWAWAINKLECSKRFLNLGQLWLWATISIV